MLDRLYQGALENLATIDSLNFNGTILFLREFGRDAEADTLARDYVAAQPDAPRFFDLRYHHFSADAPPDPALVAAFEARRDIRKDDSDPAALLFAIAGGQPWSDEDIRLLAGVTPDAFETMIVNTEGEDLRRLIQTALQIARDNAHDDPAFLASLSKALTRIAAISPMATRLLKACGFTVAEAGADEATELP